MIEIISLDNELFVRYGDKIRELIREAMLFNFPSSIIEESYYDDTFNNLGIYINNGSAKVYVAIKDKELCGWIWCHEIHRFDKKRLHVAHFAVFEQYRKFGIGRQLIDIAEKYAHENGCSGMDLFVTEGNQAAVYFYERRGYEVERYLLRKEF